MKNTDKEIVQKGVTLLGEIFTLGDSISEEVTLRNTQAYLDKNAEYEKVLAQIETNPETAKEFSAIVKEKFKKS